MLKYFPRIIFTVTACFMALTGVSQQGTIKCIVNAGMQQVNSPGICRYFNFEEGGYISKQSGTTFFDASVLCIVQPKTHFKRFAFIAGLGANQKGFIQTGAASPGAGPYYQFTATTTLTYLALHTGFSFDAISHKKYRISIGQLIIPECLIASGRGQIYNLFPVSTRTFMAADYFFTEHLGMRLSPYFQTALINYNVMEPLEGYSNFRPYCFGFTLGVIF